MSQLSDEKCPCCGSLHISVSPFESDLNIAWCVADCADCKKEWRWLYKISGVEVYPGVVEES